MTLCLTGRSALAYYNWRRLLNADYEAWGQFDLGIVGPAPLREAGKRLVEDATASDEEVFALLKAYPEVFGGHLDVMVGSLAARRLSNCKSCVLLRSSLPRGAVLDAGECLVASPALALMHAAGSRPLVEVVRLASGLAGAYAINVRARACDQGARGRRIVGTRPLTSVFELGRMLDRLACDLRPRCAGGIAVARRACGLAFDNAASPMEIIAALLLALPARLGGFGLPRPVLNPKLEVPLSLRDCVQKDAYRPDLYWPARGIALEYDSDQEHTGSDRIAADSARRNALLTMGVQVVGLTRAQLYEAEELGLVARQLAKQLGVRLRGPERVDNWAQLHKALRQQLLHPGESLAI